jgi:hypothetical protein
MGELAIVEVPGLESEGEIMGTPASTNPIEDAKLSEHSKIKKIESPNTHGPQNLCTRPTKVDYQHLANPSI